MTIHHQIVGGPQRTTVALGVEIGDGAIVQVDALDPPTDVARGIEPTGKQQTAELGRAGRATIVAEVHRAIGADRRAVGPALDLGDRLLRAIGVHERQPRAEHLDDDHAAVRHGDRALGKAEAIGDLGQFRRELGEVGHRPILAGRWPAARDGRVVRRVSRDRA